MSSEMGYFVVGVSGATCSGKTSLTKLLQRSFPWSRLVHQDHYYHDDDWPQHIRVPEAENHVNYEIHHSLDMEKMYKDVQELFERPAELMNVGQSTNTATGGSESSGGGGAVGDKAETPNYDDKFLQQVPNIDVDLSKYRGVPILIIEGITIFGSQYLFDKCDARIFCSLDEDTCRKRRSLRSYFPPDTPNYFDKVIWPEYEKHLDSYISTRAGVTVFDGSGPIEDIWKSSIQIITCRMEEKIGAKSLTKGNADCEK